MQDMHSVGGGGGRFFIVGGGGGDRQIRTHHHNHALVAAAAKCPRCDSGNTKFCYYNNYNLSQPRHFCKSCHRYWTKGGVLRNVPIGGGCRKSKRPASKPNPHQEKGEEAAKSSEKPPIISQAAPNNNSCSSDSLSPSASAIEIASNPRSAVAVSDLMNGVLDSVSISASAPEAVTEYSTLIGTSVSASNSLSGLINGTGNSNLYGHAGGIEWTAVINGHGSASDGGYFPEIGTLTSLIPQPSDQTTVFSLGGRTVNQIQAQRENEVGILYDPFHGRSFFGNGGFGPLNWRTSASEDQGLFDTVDQTYWSQSQWSAMKIRLIIIFP